MSIPGKEASAISDLGKVLEIRPSFATALKQRCSLFLKLGQLDEAEKDVTQLASFEDGKSTKGGHDRPGDTTQHQQILENIALVKQSIEEAQKFLSKKEYQQCTQSASAGLSISPAFSKLLKIRIECNLHQGFSNAIVRDLNTLELHGFNENLYTQDALIQYFSLYKYDAARSKLQRCLQLDMDSKPCKSAFIEISSFEKKFGKFCGIADPATEPKKPLADKVWAEARKGLVAGLETEARAEVSKVYEKIGFPKSRVDPNTHSEILMGLEETVCVAFFNAKMFTDANATKYCSAVISRDVNSNNEDTNTERSVRPKENARVTAHLLMIENLISNDQFEKAQQELQKALELHPDNHQLLSLKQNMPTRRVQSKNTDYYKILGLSKSATDKEIRSAYREKTKQYHPDKYRGEMSADQVDKKMAQVNQAYEVLSNPALRSRFDNGDDPNNNERPDSFQHGARPDPFQQQQMFQQFNKNSRGRQNGNQHFFQHFGQQFGNGFNQQRGFNRGRKQPKRPNNGQRRNKRPTDL